MSILFIQNWDVTPGKEEEYVKFIEQTFLPQSEAEGFNIIGGYYVEIGFGPRIMAVSSTEDLGELSRLVATKHFKDLMLGLKTLVYNYKRSVYEPTGAVKKEKYSIEKGVWKFNQYYDLRPGAKKTYADFILSEYLPTMDRIGYVDVTGGWNTVFGGFSEIIGELTFKDPIDIGRLLNNDDFKRISLKLRNEFTANYLTRVLRSTERFEEPKWFRL